MLTVSSGKSKTILNVKALAFTGHSNIERIYGYDIVPNEYNQEAYNMCYSDIKIYIEFYIKEYVNTNIIIIVGMARGVDEIAGMVAMDLGLDIICAVPHSLEWHKNRDTSVKRSQAICYDKFLAYNKASWFQIRKTYSSGHIFANFARNCFMVDIATDVVSVKAYDSTGTDHCIKYAKSQNKYIGNIRITKELEW